MPASVDVQHVGGQPRAQTAEQHAPQRHVREARHRLAALDRRSVGAMPALSST
jgi:hypothetical protein